MPSTPTSHTLSGAGLYCLLIPKDSFSGSQVTIFRPGEGFVGVLKGFRHSFVRVLPYFCAICVIRPPYCRLIPVQNVNFSGKIKIFGGEVELYHPTLFKNRGWSVKNFIF